MPDLGIIVVVFLRAVFQVLLFFQYRPSTPHYNQFSGAYFKVRRWMLNVGRSKAFQNCRDQRPRKILRNQLHCLNLAIEVIHGGEVHIVRGAP